MDNFLELDTNACFLVTLVWSSSLLVGLVQAMSILYPLGLSVVANLLNLVNSRLI